MAFLQGRWTLASSEGLLDYFKATGADADTLERAKRLEVPGDAGAKEEFSVSGDQITRRVIKPDGSVHSEGTVTVGKETAGKTLDGRDTKVTTTVSGNTVTRAENGQGYTAHWERTVSGNDMTLVMKCGGVTCTRKYTKA